MAFNFGDWLKDEAGKIPGNKWASSSRLGDVLTGGVSRAINRDQWNIPSMRGNQTSIDDLAAVGSGNSSLYRNTARGVGALFGMSGANSVGGTGTSSALGGIR